MERKKEADSIQSEDRKIELLLQEAFDYSDEQLLRELEMAEAQVKSAKMAEEEELDRAQELEPADKGENAAPSDEFEEILKKMRERGIKPKLERELSAAASHPIIELDTHLRSAETSEPERPPEKETEKVEKRQIQTIQLWKIPTSRVVLPAGYGDFFWLLQLQELCCGPLG